MRFGQGTNRITGTVVMDRRTKCLVKRIQPGQIAVIDHPDLDEVAAEELVENRVRAVINAASSISGVYPARGAAYLIRSGIPVVDRAGADIFCRLQEGDRIWLDHDRVGKVGESQAVVRGERLSAQTVWEKIHQTQSHFNQTVVAFMENTLHYAVSEKRWFMRPLAVPGMYTQLKGKQVVVVVRGTGYKEDLAAIYHFIKAERPVLIGVDGGADALLQCGWKPDVIVGDMDSVSDEALCSGAELVVHAYPNGDAPGLERVEKLGLAAHILPGMGTSEDVALLLADQEGAERIIAVGTHSHIIDFLEKGRNGMASTLLTRIKVGGKLVDVSGIRHFYPPKTERRRKAPLWAAVFSAPMAVAALPGSFTIDDSWLRMVWLSLRLWYFP
ncbi:putative cytokinetic ring protein SteA [Marinithermofilum abyssi]|nr:putative cytokinetic ring protein SteA [Marinithermofilum abyssi]